MSVPESDSRPNLIRRPRNVHLRRGLILLSALGPGILGLMADNDAGGMTSYLLTGARHQLLLFVPALVFMGLVTLFVQDMALRVALGTRTPFAKLVTARFGAASSQTLALLLHALNILVLATEFSGMAMALSLTGMNFAVATGLSLVLVLILTSAPRYRTIERLLLAIALLNVAFLAAVFALPHVTTVQNPFLWQPAAGGTAFYLLALAGNAMAPWMVYWQQNAVVARGMKAWEIRRGRFDLVVGVMAQIGMAAVVLWLGASLVGSPAGLFNPLAWVQMQAGQMVTALFALGLFDVGLMAAVTITYASSWMLSEAFAREGHPARQGTRIVPRIHRISLACAALVVLLPGWPQGFLALFVQALAALMMPMTLWFLGVLANDRRLTHGFANQPWQRVAWPLLLIFFLALSAAAWL